MKFQIFKLLVVVVLSTVCAKGNSAKPYYYLEVNVNNVLIQKGKIHIGVYNNESDYDNEKYYVGSITDVKNKTVKIVFKLPKGTYAVKMFQDINGDNEMNSIFGVPLEPYGVSRNISGFPSFKKTKFMLGGNKKINIKLKN